MARKLTVAFQGEPGAFSEEAIWAYFGAAQVEPVPLPDFEAVFETLEKGQVDRAMIPIENSLFGSVHVNYDLLRAHAVSIVGELELRIRHHLLGLPGSRIKQIQRVYSHPQALGQCQAYLRTHLHHAEAIPAYDTAGAARMVAEMNDPKAAAIAGLRAAAKYGLEVLASGIESHPQNYTRFLVLARADIEPPKGPPGTMKTSIVFALRENVPGALFKSLAVFALRDLDLYKIESRPLVGMPGSYLFYLDVAGSVHEQAVQRALDHLAEVAAFVRVLGSYPRGRRVD
ncbi:prephenate dehydratase [Rhodothermus profundi]|uniref:Bifunctional chorismate mutase/prephenate dehydratase n=1 Tax=Rhodothermus profundi TaxID=633813 RepID=A0A1M6UH77_9BACT|nr:prephenate dehydratase [Rhodothermus profundi]SHK68564.1 prephenate dehydratase [Rhodothermus profundi]